jgi:hypothetical protein
MLSSCIAVLLTAAATASVVDIPATITGTADCDNYSSYNKSVGFLSYGLVAPHGAPFDYCAYLKFGLDTLPDTFALISAKLDYYQFAHNGVPSVTVKLIGDPVPLSAHDLFEEIRGAPAIAPTKQSQDGWMELTLDSPALALIDSCRRTGWISLAIDHVGEGSDGFAHGYSDSMPPLLCIEYTSSGTREARGNAVIRPELAFAPNPAGGRVVTVQYNIAAGTLGKLALRDVLGRTVKSLALVPSGSTRLDLRGFAPGVYIAALKAQGYSVSRKLIITAR